MFVSPPPSVDWLQVSVPAAQTSVGIEDVDWAALGAREEAAAKVAGKRPAASKRRQAIFTLSDDDAEEGEDADTFRLVPRKRRKQLESMGKGVSSVPMGPTSSTLVKDAAESTSGVPGQGTRPAMEATTRPSTPSTTAARRTSGGGVEHQGPATVLDVEGDHESPTQHVEQARLKRCAFATSFRASNM